MDVIHSIKTQIVSSHLVSDHSSFGRWGTATNIITKGGKGARAHSYLLVLDSQQKSLQLFGFTKEELPKAQQRYLEVKKNAIKPWMQTVRVAVSSVAALPRAYPNYYLDSTAFLQMVQRAIG